MVTKVRLPLVFLLLFSLLLVSATKALGTKHPELKMCKKECKHQEQLDKPQMKECEDWCEMYYGENQRREGGAWNPDQSPVERMREYCERRCASTEEQHRPQCRLQCAEEFKREQAGGGGGQEQEQNPYVFEDQHFTTRFQTEQGRLRVLPKFTDRSELLRGIENYRVVIFEAEPQGFLVPSHWDAEAVSFVVQGRGSHSLGGHERRESFNFKSGDIFYAPPGTTGYTLNRDKNEKLVVVKLIRPANTPGHFESFFGAGGSENPESFFRAFSDDILAAAFKARRDRLQWLFGRQKQGVIIKATEEQIKELSRHEGGGIWPFGGESKGPVNIFDKRPTQSNRYGSLHKVDASDHKGLQELNVAISFANITQGSMSGPFYNSRSNKIAVVVGGEGYLEMACPHLSESAGSQEGGGPRYQRVSARLRPAVVVIIPTGHPVVIVASKNKNLQILYFDINAQNNQEYPLAGKRNVISQLEEAAKELAFDAPAEEVDEIFQRQDEEYFFEGPRQQSEGRAYA